MIRLPALRAALLLALAHLLASCTATPNVQRADRPDLALIGDMPWVPGTEAAVRAWVEAKAHPRDRSVDLTSDPAYVETATAEGSSVPRVGYFFLKEPWRVGAVVYWLSRAEVAPKLGEPAGELWGMPLFRTEGRSELYAPEAHLLLRVIFKEFRPPPRPAPELPEHVAIKTRTRTFHRDRLFALHQGRIWFKRNPDREGTLREPWRLLGEGLPWPRPEAKQFDRPQRLTQLSADGDDLLAVDDRGRIYLCTTRSSSVSSQDGWEDGWGFPGKRPLLLEGRAASPRALAIGRRAEHALYFEDAIGNPHHMGPMGTTTLYLLHRDGGELLFTDNGLPNDFSRNLCAPDDGRFEALNLSASASAILLIDRYGRLVTRFDDYDLNGGTPNFEYSYRSVVRPDDRGDSLATSITPYYLPLQPWLWHAPPPLQGQARLSRELTVLQTGQGNAARELRVAGLGAAGQSGYYRKGIDQTVWDFVADPSLALDPQGLLSPENVARGSAEYTRTGGRLEASTLPRGRSYRGTWQGQLLRPGQAAQDPKNPPAGETPLEPVEGVAVALDWNPFCPPGRLQLTVGGQSLPVTLHTVDLWTPEKRLRPGFDGTPLLLLGTLVMEDAVLADIRPEVQAVLRLLRPFHHATFGLLVSLDDTHLELRAIDEGQTRNHPLVMRLQRTGAYDPPEPASTGAATRGTLAWLRSGQLDTLLAAPDLVVDPATASREALRTALTENQQLHDQLQRTLQANRERLAAVQAFADQWRFLAPLLPLGRVTQLPRLLSLENLTGQRSAQELHSRWTRLQAQLQARIQSYRAVLEKQPSP